MKKLNKKQIHTLGYNYAIFVCGEREKLKSSLKDMFLIYRENYNLPKKYKTQRRPNGNCQSIYQRHKRIFHIQ
jgi:hypothetical protein